MSQHPVIHIASPNPKPKHNPQTGHHFSRSCDRLRQAAATNSQLPHHFYSSPHRQCFFSALKLPPLAAQSWLLNPSFPPVPPGREARHPHATRSARATKKLASARQSLATALETRGDQATLKAPPDRILFGRLTPRVFELPPLPLPRPGPDSKQERRE